MAFDALSLLSKVDIEKQSNEHLKAALLTTKGGASRDANLRDEALALAERAHSSDPKSFHPCTLIGALKYELGDYASGDIWFAKAVERGASRSSIDQELRTIVRRADKETKERLKRHLLQVDPDRFGWVRGRPEGVTVMHAYIQLIRNLFIRRTSAATGRRPHSPDRPSDI